MTKCKHKEALEALQTQIHQHIELRLEHGYVTANTPEIEAAISALQALQAASWRDIETAPRDGTAIIVAGKAVEPHKGMYVCEAAGCEDGFFTCQGMLKIQPSKWQPFPAAPVDGGG